MHRGGLNKELSDGSSNVWEVTFSIIENGVERKIKTPWSDYNYVMGNPVMLIDPDGRSPQYQIIDANGAVLHDDGNDDGNLYLANGESDLEELKKKHKE